MKLPLIINAEVWTPKLISLVQKTKLLSAAYDFILCNFLLSSLLQLATKFTPETLIHPDDPRMTQPPATLYDWSNQNNLRQFNLTRVQKGIQAPSENEDTTTIASAFVRAKAKKEHFKKLVFVWLKVHIIYTLDMIVRISVPISYHYLKKQIQMNAKILSETLMVRLALNWINILKMVLSFI